MKVLVKFPTRERRVKFLTTLGVYQRTKKNSDTRFLITLDSDDSQMNCDSAKNLLSMWGNMDVVFGISGSKVIACNRDLNEHAKPWDIVVLASDDMTPVVSGWDDIIISDMKKYFPDTDGVLFYNDGFTPLNTMCIIGRRYYERFNYIYHPDYVSLWCDNDFMNVADILGKQVYINRTIIRHEHYSNINGKMDALMRKNEGYYHKDMETFNRRKEKNFYL